MKNLEEEQIQNPGEVAPPVAAETVEQEPSIREIGRERIDKIGAFFSRAKEGFKDKVRQTGQAISGAVGRVKELGIAGVETVMGAPEAGMRALEYGVGSTVVAYEKSKEAVSHVKNEVVRVKNEVLEQGASAIENGVKTVVEAKNATLDFGERAFYRAAERMSKPFVAFQASRLQELSARVEARLNAGGAAKREDLNEIMSIVTQMKGLERLQNVTQ